MDRGIQNTLQRIKKIKLAAGEKQGHSDQLLLKKEAIETAYGQELVWERMDNKRMSRIKAEFQEVSIFNNIAPGL